MRLGLVIPLLNEAALVTDVVTSIRQVLEAANIDSTLVLVDNGSTDDTGRIVDDLAQNPGVVALHLDENAGYGGGIAAGLAHLHAHDPPEVIGWCWGDGQVDPSALPVLFRACASGTPLAKIVRTERRDGLLRIIITTIYGLVTRMLGIRSTDVNGCPKLFRREALLDLDPQRTDWLLDAEVVIEAERRGLEIAEHPTVMAPRAAGRSKVGWTTVFQFAWNLLRWRITGRL